MKTSTVGRLILEAREGKRNAAYRDSKGVWTIGVGHTAAAGAPAPFAGLTLSDAAVDELFAKDLAKYEATLNSCLKVAVADHEYDGLISIGYNIGQSGETNSTFMKRLNAGDHVGAAAGISMWEKDAILIPRREAERKQFETPYSVALPSRIIGEAPPSAVVAAWSPVAAKPPARATVTTLAPKAAVAPPMGLWARLASLFHKAA